MILKIFFLYAPGGKIVAVGRKNASYYFSGSRGR